MRRVEFGLETGEDGYMAFRTMQVFGLKKLDAYPAADGQLGTIIRLYRDFKISGNRQLVADLYDKAALALDFAFTRWDADGDGVLDSQKHNTYDIEFYGPDSLSNSMFFAALKAGAEMAELMGDTGRAERYRDALEKGSRRMDSLLWNGEYYIQLLDDVDAWRYQYGEGCLADQLFGQLQAHVAGLGHILPEEHVKQAIRAVFRHNFRAELSAHHNVQRTYALNDESGLLVCSWPRGGRPRQPFIYSDEVWTGIEYQVAAHLIYEGFVDDGLTLVKAVRARQDGYRRNPWDEVECGHHYARSLSSWALLLALSGFSYDLDRGWIRFRPAIHKDRFSCFFSTGKAWGIYRRESDPWGGKYREQIEVLWGSLDGVELLPGKD
jgi:uncharacterized protein (DUF608 family)